MDMGYFGEEGTPLHARGDRGGDREGLGRRWPASSTPSAAGRSGPRPTRLALARVGLVGLERVEGVKAIAHARKIKTERWPGASLQRRTSRTSRASGVSPAEGGEDGQGCAGSSGAGPGRGKAKGVIGRGPQVAEGLHARDPYRRAPGPGAQAWRQGRDRARLRWQPRWCARRAKRKKLRILAAVRQARRHIRPSVSTMQ